MKKITNRIKEKNEMIEVNDDFFNEQLFSNRDVGLQIKILSIFFKIVKIQIDETKYLEIDKSFIESLDLSPSEFGLFIKIIHNIGSYIPHISDIEDLIPLLKKKYLSISLGLSL